jgi:hypothetical protein
MTEHLHSTLTGARQKADETSRVDTRLSRDAEDARNERLWNAAIDARDHRACRACGRRSDPDGIGLATRGHRHHIVYRSAGGKGEPSNILTLCFSCHSDEHKNRLRFTEDGLGYDKLDANTGLCFWRKDSVGEWYLEHRETAPHVTEKD